MSELNEIESLIQLLDDPDDKVFEVVKDKLNDLGTPVIPYLEKAWEESFDTLFQSRIEDITQNIQFSVIKKRLEDWSKQENNDLFEGALIIASYQYPEMDEYEVRREFDKLKTQIWLEINSQFTALEKIRIVNHILYNLSAYERSTSFNRSVQSHFINNILISKKGSPIGLAILYSALAQRLDMPIYGVALAKNFIVGYKTDDVTKNIFNTEFEYDVLFYINPYNRGVAFGKKEIEEFIDKYKIDYDEKYFKPCSNKQTIIELVKMLIDFYKREGSEIKENECQSLLDILYI